MLQILLAKRKVIPSIPDFRPLVPLSHSSGTGSPGRRSAISHKSLLPEIQSIRRNNTEKSTTIIMTNHVYCWQQLPVVASSGNKLLSLKIIIILSRDLMFYCLSSLSYHSSAGSKFVWRRKKQWRIKRRTRACASRYSSSCCIIKKVRRARRTAP